MKKNQKNYYFLDDKPISLLKTQGNRVLSRPIAVIKLLEATHFNINGEVWTKGKYRVLETFDVEDSQIQFKGFSRVKKEK